jgi:glycosyltransferase involved in cell wall biosynthesis
MTPTAPVGIEPTVALPQQPVAAAARVFMLDLLSIVPYYTSELSAALLRGHGVELELGAIAYYLDPDCYRRQGLSFSPAIQDVVSRAGRLPRPIRRIAKTVEYLANLTRLWVRFQTAKPDLVHVQFLPLVLFGSSIELRFLRSLRRRGVRIVYTVHNVLPHDASPHLRSHYADLYNLADHLICHDVPSSRQLIQDFGQARSRISVIAHGPLLTPDRHDTSEAARRRLGLSMSECLMLWQGILRPYKGVEFLLDAWRHVRTFGKPARLAIVGGGDEAIERRIRAKVAELNLTNSVKLDLRFVSVPELQDYHAAADVLVYPYSEVTTSGALMTGIGYGKAVIASRLPAFEQILRHDRNALLAAYGDVEEWSRSIERLIADPALRRRLGESLRGGSSAVPGWDCIARQTVACYHSVLQSRAR